MRPESLEPEKVILTLFTGPCHNYYPLGYRIVYMPAGPPPSDQIVIKQVAQASRLCRRRLSPEVTKNSFFKATPQKTTRSRPHLLGRAGSLVVIWAGVGGEIDQKNSRRQPESGLFTGIEAFFDLSSGEKIRIIKKRPAEPAAALSPHLAAPHGERSEVSPGREG